MSPHCKWASLHWTETCWLSWMLLLPSLLSQLSRCAVSSNAGFPGQRKRLRRDMLNGKQPRRMQTNWTLCHHSTSWQRSLEVLAIPTPTHETHLFFWYYFLYAWMQRDRCSLRVNQSGSLGTTIKILPWCGKHFLFICIKPADFVEADMVI